MLLPTFELPCERVGGVPEVSVLVPEGGALLVLAAGPHQGSAVLLHRRLHAEDRLVPGIIIARVLQCTVGEIRVFCPMGVLGVFI